MKIITWVRRRRHAEVAILLLEAGADSEQEDREDLTALHWAARMGKERTLAVLLDHRADVEVREKSLTHSLPPFPSHLAFHPRGEIIQYCTVQ